MSPLIETIAVSLLAVAGWLLGRWCSRLPKPWWLLGYFVPLALIVLVALPRLDRRLEFVPPMSWLISGRTLFAISGFVVTMILTTPLSRLPVPGQRRAVCLFMVLLVLSSSVWPFFAPVLNRRFQASLVTRLDLDGICRQSTDYNCGPAAAVTALRKLGLPAEEGEIAIAAHTSTAIGTPPDVLKAALQKRYGRHGLIVEYRHFNSIAELNNGGVTLAVVKFGLLVDHYVAVLEVRPDEIVLGDPFLGLTRCSPDEFRARWHYTGVVLKKVQ